MFLALNGTLEKTGLEHLVPVNVEEWFLSKRSSKSPCPKLSKAPIPLALTGTHWERWVTTAAWTI